VPVTTENDESDTISSSVGDVSEYFAAQIYNCKNAGVAPTGTVILRGAFDLATGVVGKYHIPVDPSRIAAYTRSVAAPLLPSDGYVHEIATVVPVLTAAVTAIPHSFPHTSFIRGKGSTSSKFPMFWEMK
jgi:hypothetical protein